MPAPNLLVLSRRLLCDHLTPVLAYRRLVREDDRTAPSFLLESVEQGGAVGRYSMLGARPAMEVLARERQVTLVDHGRGSTRVMEQDDPLQVVRSISRSLVPFAPQGSLPVFHGGWVGMAGFDAVRWLEPLKLPFTSAPPDDRRLPDLHMGLYRSVVVFDHVTRLMHAVTAVPLDDHASESAAHEVGERELDGIEGQLASEAPPLDSAAINMDLAALPAAPARSSFSREGFEQAVRTAQEYIAAGDIFQVVLSQRLERSTSADPFEIYRALRVVNPSPYMIYLQTAGAILIASSPEILCRTRGPIVTSRPLAGTRPRDSDPERDRALEAELLADEKERAEHVMLVDLARNDLSRVCAHGTVEVAESMAIERFSHVMHISSTVIGRLHDGMDGWDALRASLPVGTVSGAPKVRAIQIIDELEPVRRGPYAGGIGCVGWNGDMDIAIALRTMVIPTTLEPGGIALRTEPPWTVWLQAGAGVVLDSDPRREFEETMRKAAALGRAIDLAEHAFSRERRLRSPRGRR
ncbi:MAG: anthranilate synthase component I [Phycisphaeraceae bacterium]|nr:anthranilate synthase component I [Phycisphaeraceae bacterium]